MKTGTGAWYTEKGTTTAPSNVEGMVWIVRCGKYVALVPADNDKEKEH